jgi:ubiquinone/menaquinone biosynthesis C-methylase UbiE
VPPKVKSDAKKAVRDYWAAAPCGRSLTKAKPGTKAFFDEIEAMRYRLEPFIPKFAEFEIWRGKRVLEIGVGLGTDFVRFARAGAKLSGIDLTEASIDLVRRRLALEGLNAQLRVADAEALPFLDESFDLVYSWGVLHHTPDPAEATAEIRRVLRPDGEARIMLYSRRSWFALAAWFRYALLSGRPWRSISSVLAEHLESPGTKAFTRRELDELFASFRTTSVEGFVTSYDQRFARGLADVSGPRFGWFTGIIARK